MKLGQTFKYRKSGWHEDVTLVILHNYEENRRVLYCPEIGCYWGLHALLYARMDRRLSRQEIIDLQYAYDKSKFKMKKADG